MGHHIAVNWFVSGIYIYITQINPVYTELYTQLYPMSTTLHQPIGSPGTVTLCFPRGLHGAPGACGGRAAPVGLGEGGPPRPAGGFQVRARLGAMESAGNHVGFHREEW